MMKQKTFITDCALLKKGIGNKMNIIIIAFFSFILYFSVWFLYELIFGESEPDEYYY
jgi:hypothetical protein